MIKETKRKGFNFYRSYYDVFNELSEKDKLVFINALLDKQFLDIDPENLTGMVKFAWISQYNSIDQQVKGYKSKSKDPMQGGRQGGRQGGSVRGKITPTLQEKEKEKEQYVMFDKFWNYYDKKRNKDKTKKLFYNLSNESLELIRLNLPKYLESTPDKKYRKDPDVYLRNECWNDEVIIAKPVKIERL